jgi:T5SS/PEP-CTERM-associated repeat protein
MLQKKWHKTLGWSFLTIAGFLLIGSEPAHSQLIVTTDTTQNGGTLTVSPAHAIIVSHTSNDPTLSLTNGATANFASGVEAVVVGSLTGEAGSLVINGGSTLSNVGAGTGLLGTYGSVSVLRRNGYIGLNAGSTGAVTVCGSGSTWNNSGSLGVGHMGNGTLAIDAGGLVNSSTGSIGSSSGSTGAVTVSGISSTWNISSVLYVGDSGNGTLEVVDGGLVNNSFGLIGTNSDSTGAVTVSGIGSTWNNSSELIVGDFGTGTMEVNDGGLVTNTTGYIGAFSGSSGEVTVSGSGSTWHNSENLILGGVGLTDATTGHGTLTIADGGTVTVVGTTRVHGDVDNPSEIHLQSGGRLITHSLDPSGGGYFNIGHGTLELTGGTFNGDLSLKRDATLAGIGTVTGDLSLSGTLDPGNSPGTININGDLLWGAMGRINFELGESNSDLIVVAGELVSGRSGAGRFYFSNAGDLVPGTYTLMTFGSTDFLLSEFRYSSDISGFSGEFGWNGNSLQFVVTAVPEPSAATLALAGILVPMILTGRRRKSSTRWQKRRIGLQRRAGDQFCLILQLKIVKRQVH